MRPLAEEVTSIVRLKLKNLDPSRPDEELDASAALITQMASALMLSSALPPTDESHPPTIHDLAWVWPRLL